MPVYGSAPFSTRWASRRSHSPLWASLGRPCPVAAEPIFSSRARGGRARGGQPGAGNTPHPKNAALPGGGAYAPSRRSTGRPGLVRSAVHVDGLGHALGTVENVDGVGDAEVVNAYDAPGRARQSGVPVAASGLGDYAVPADSRHSTTI